MHCIDRGVAACGMVSTLRVVASNRQTETLGSELFFVFDVLSHHKHPEFPGIELNLGYCLSHNLSLAMALTLHLNRIERSLFKLFKP